MNSPWPSRPGDPSPDEPKTRNHAVAGYRLSAMRKRLLLLTTIFSMLFALPASADTQVNDKAEYRKLLGTHKFSLQWVSWEQFGKVAITDQGGTLRVRGSQELNGDYVRIDGSVRSVSKGRAV